MKARTESAGLDVEWLALERGVKPAIRITLPAERLDAYLARVRAAGLSHVRAERPAHLPGRSVQEVLYVAHDVACAEAVREAEATILPGGPSRRPDDDVLAAHRKLGALLGYPACCVEAFLERLRRGVTRRTAGGEAHEDFVAAEDALARSVRLDPRLNNLLFERQTRLVSFYPCRFDCPEGLAVANAIFRALHDAAPVSANAMLDSLAVRVVLYADGSREVGDAPDATNALALDFHLS